MELETNRVILPLSGASVTKNTALNLITALAPFLWGFKLHPATIIRLLREEGFDVIEACKNAGAKVFIDLKGYDIPSEVAEMVSDLEASGANIITIHASGGPKMLEAAANASHRVKLLAITILTTMEIEEVGAIYYGEEGSSADQSHLDTKVRQFAKLAYDYNFDGTVSSAADLALLNNDSLYGGPEMIRCTPGIRPLETSVVDDDQSRVLTPTKAINAGSDLLVVGRPIKNAKDPIVAANAINEEVLEAISAL